MKTDSVTLWQNRIQDRIASGMKVNDWCKQNGISRDTYYYWHHRIKNLQDTKKNIFAEVLPIPTKAPQTEKFHSTEVVISWKSFSISVSDQHTITMLVELMSSLGKILLQRPVYLSSVIEKEIS